MDNKFWEKVIDPASDSPITNQSIYSPKSLKTSINQKIAYDPTIMQSLVNTMMVPNDLTITYFSPVYLFPKQGMGGIVTGRIKTKAFLSEFKPDDMDEVACTLQILEVTSVR